MRRQVTSAEDVDLLMLIREEEVYCGRIREALVFSENKIQRTALPLMELDQTEREARRSLYTRPTSIAERLEDEQETLDEVKAPRRSCDREREFSLPKAAAAPFTNPDVDRRRTVDDNDALYSAESQIQNPAEFSYADLVAVHQGRKKISARALRRLANLWGINPKLRKEEMLNKLLAQCARRNPDEVEAVEKKRETSVTRRPARQRPRRR